MDVRSAIARACERRDLGADDMAEVVGRIMEGEATPAQVGALLVALRMKGETVAEVVGAARAMRARMVRVPLDGPVAIDLCGTGGDGSGTVNISTLASFIVAGAGVMVAKHGNRALSSRSGSHDVLEKLGLDPAPSPEAAVRCLGEVRLAFLFAPAYHAATKHAAGPRREIGVRTLFNLLGPLTNPAGTRYHMNGVFAADRCEFLARAHGELGSERALVVSAALRDAAGAPAGALDELAPAGPTRVAELREGSVRVYDVTPADFGLDEVDPVGLRGGEPAFNAEVLLRALGMGSGVADGNRAAEAAVRTAALMAAGAGLYVAGAAPDLRRGAELAAEALRDGRARAVLERLRLLTPLPQAAGPS